MDIDFRPVTIPDLPTLLTWMQRPHWREWWGDPETEVGYVRDMLEGRDTTRPFIFRIDGNDSGYIQYWTIADQLFEPWLSEAPWMTALPDGAIGVDMSLAENANLGRGIGTRVLSQFVAMLQSEGHREIFIDPAPVNLRAIRAYEKAGFRLWPDLEGKTDDCLIMRFEGATDAC